MHNTGSRSLVGRVPETKCGKKRIFSSEVSFISAKYLAHDTAFDKLKIKSSSIHNICDESRNGSNLVETTGFLPVL